MSARPSLPVRLLPVVIVAAAAALRFWALGQGLPLAMNRPDESELLEHTAGFSSGDWNPHWMIYPNLYLYVVWGWEELVLALRRAIVPAPSYSAMVGSRLPDLILWGRAFSAAIGTATVVLVWVIGRRAGGRTLGLVAAALLAANFLHVRDSHALKSDVVLAFGVTASVGLLVRYVERPGRTAATVAGVAIGLSMGAKYTAIVLLVPAYVAVVLGAPGRGWRRLVPGADFVLLAAAAATVFLVTSPFTLLDLPEMRRTVAIHFMSQFQSRVGTAAQPGRGWVKGLGSVLAQRAAAYHVTVSLRHGCGVLVALATPLALLAALRRSRQPALVVATAAVAALYGVIGCSPTHLARYFTPLTPLLALLVAALVVQVAAALPPARRALALVALTAALIAEPLASAVAYDRIAERTDTRVLATRWMTDHLPPGAAIAVLGSVYFPIADPDVPPGTRRIALPLGATDLARRGVGYVVTHEHHQIPFSRLIPQQIEALRPHLHLLAEFSPYRDGPAGVFEDEDAYYVPFYDFAGVVRPGPVVRVYAYDTSPDGGAGLPSPRRAAAIAPAATS